MKRYLPLGILVLALVYITTTGFQCGSTEMTSAKLAISQKQFDKAEANLLKELARNDKNEEAWFILGQVRFDMKKYIEMNDAFTHALQIGPAHKNDIKQYRIAVWSLMVNEGIGFYNRGRDTASFYKDAIEKFNTAIVVRPDTAMTYSLRAKSYFYGLQDQKTALADFEKVLELDPTDKEAADLIGRMRFNRGMEALAAKDTAGSQKEFLAAVDAFEKVYKLNPGDADNISNLMDVYIRTNQTEKALALTKTAVEKEPGNKVFRYNYGVFLLKQEKFEEAAEQFKKATEIDPTYSEAVYNLGASYLHWGIALREAAKKKAEEEAAKSKNKGKEVKDDLSYQDKLRLALPYLEKARTLRPEDADLIQRLGQVYANLGMKDKAKAAFDEFDRLSKGK
jgi:tetratricopeptide (TPR) repeat protein